MKIGNALKLSLNGSWVSDYNITNDRPGGSRNSNLRSPMPAAIGSRATCSKSTIALLHPRMLSLLNETVYQNANSLMATRIFGFGWFWLQEFTLSLRSQIRSQSKMGMLQALEYTSNYLLTSGTPIIAVVLSIHLYLAHLLSIGSVVAIYSLTSMFYHPVSGVIQGVNSVLSSRHNYIRVSEITGLGRVLEEPIGKSVPEVNPPSIQMQSVVLIHDRPQWQAHIPDMTLNLGKLHFLIGDNGIGKSTLLKALAGVNTSYSGRLEVSGVEVGVLPHNWRKRNLLLLSPEMIIPLAVLSRITYTENETLQIEKHLGVDIEGMLSRKDAVLVERLSVGQRQRFNLAVALLMKPKILLLDEILSHVDMETQDSALSYLRTLVNDTLIIIVTHDVSLLHDDDAVHNLAEARRERNGGILTSAR